MEYLKYKCQGEEQREIGITGKVKVQEGNDHQGGMTKMPLTRIITATEHPWARYVL